MSISNGIIKEEPDKAVRLIQTNKSESLIRRHSVARDTTWVYYILVGHVAQRCVVKKARENSVSR